MMNMVRNSASPMRIWFDGISCVPSACRRKWKTMAMRVNDVIVTRIAGRNEISVSSRTICSGADSDPMPFSCRSTVVHAQRLVFGGWLGRSSAARSTSDIVDGREAEQQPAAFDGDDHERAPLAERHRGLDDDRPANRCERPKRAAAQQPGQRRPPAPARPRTARSARSRLVLAARRRHDLGQADGGAVVEDGDFAVWRSATPLTQHLHVGAGRLRQAG